MQTKVSDNGIPLKIRDVLITRAIFFIMRLFHISEIEFMNKNIYRNGPIQ